MTSNPQPHSEKSLPTGERRAERERRLGWAVFWMGLLCLIMVVLAFCVDMGGFSLIAAMLFIGTIVYGAGAIARSWRFGRKSGGAWLIGCGLLLAGLGFVICMIIILPGFLEARPREKISGIKAKQREMATALERFYEAHGAYPAWSSARGENLFGAVTVEALPADQPTFLAAPAGGAATLTTPVAYIATYPHDPFFGSAHMPPSYYADGKHWVIWQAGPDKTFDLTLSAMRRCLAAGGAVERAFVGFTYDPTNGTLSHGDVIRTNR